MVGLTVGLNNVQTGDLTLQRTGDVRVGTSFERFAGEVLDSTYQLRFLQRTVTYDDHVVDFRIIFCNGKIDSRAIADRNFLRFVTEERTYQHVGRFCVDAVRTVRIGNGTYCRSFDHDRRTCKRAVGRSVGNGTRNRLALCENAR